LSGTGESDAHKAYKTSKDSTADDVAVLDRANNF